MSLRGIPTTPEHEDATTPPARTLLLVVGDGHFATYPVAPDAVLTLGRDPACDVPLDHRRISRHHARIRALATEGAIPGVVMEDLGSTNGIVVRNERVGTGERVELRLGESAQIGPFTVVVVADANAHKRAGPRAAITVADPTPAGVSAAVRRFAQSPVNVLIRGETGTGKEVLARTLHELSGRAGPFVGINTAALSEHLLESELFGHERGAFTGAALAKRGLLEAAAGGTFFLDEIGDLPPPLQAKLLRAIETREIYRVGGLKPIALDVRFLAATHRDLDAEVVAGRFRHDLYFRLDGITLELAPLRERRGAIAGLARTFLTELAATSGRAVPRLALEAGAALSRHDWPGNVRELRAVIERAFLLAEGDTIGAEVIMLPARAGLDPDGFREAARRHAGNVTAIARELSTSRSQVHRLAQRFGVDLEALRGRE